MNLRSLKRPFHFAPIQLEDIPRLIEIERLSFPDPAKPIKYEMELNNDLATYCSLWNETTLIGYGGIWLLADEIHIMTIATHPTHRRQQLGELLLYQLLLLGLAQGGTAATLEVRNSNTPAKQLYQKYQFLELGKRKNYYRNPTEDGAIMTLTPLDTTRLNRLFLPNIKPFLID